MGAIHKLRLLVWKNFLLRRRHYILTILELLLPATFVVVLCFIHNKPPNSFSEFESDKIFDERYETDYKSAIQGTNCAFWKYSDHCKLAFYPNNVETLSVMTRLSASLNLEKSNVVIQGYDSQEAIVKEVLESELNKDRVQTVAAIIFEDSLNSTSSISYQIRMNHRTFEDEESLMNLGPFDEQIMKTLFPWQNIRGPNFENAFRYDSTGFTALQIFLDKVLIERLAKKPPTHTYSVQPFPYPRFQKPDNGTKAVTKLLQIYLPNTVILGFLFIVPSVVGAVVAERESGIKELMKLSGVSNWLHWVAWMIVSTACLSVSVSIVVVVLFTNFTNGDKDPIITQSDWTVWWCVLLTYGVAATAFCFFVSSFFQKPIIAIISAIIVWLTTYYAPAVQFMDQDVYRNLTLPGKISIAILPNMGASWALKILCEFEASGDGFKWENIGDSISSVDFLALYQMFLMFLADTILYILLTLYVEEVVPSTFGVPKPWYFLFSRDTWCRRKPSIVTGKEQPDEIQGRPEFQPDPEGLKVGVEIKNLQKVFGGYTAVAGVSLKMYSGDIFALLGHNGAGKTTTISCCTGMIPPSSGTAIINGFDITTQRDKVRRHLGVCPQADILFQDLTVDENLQFFGGLKGLSANELRLEREELIQKLQLTEKTHVQSKSLSGGQKRKLCLGIALIGKAKVVFLDEPTSGMDVEARRVIWDLLLEERVGRTIILTTHFMEEADFLGDRIGIMSHGKLQCCGTPFFLKKFYGTGYTLNLITASENKGDEILSIVQKYIPNASFKEEQRNLNELPINMPIDYTDSSSMSVFPAMFKDLSDQKDTLEIKSIGLTLTSMDEVFIRVGEVSSPTRRTHSSLERIQEKLVAVVDAENSPVNLPAIPTETGDDKIEVQMISQNEEMQIIENSPDVAEKRNVVMDENDYAINDRQPDSAIADVEQHVPIPGPEPDRQKSKGLRRMYQQLLGLLIKRVVYFRRKWALLLVQFIFPVLLVIVAILSANKPLVVKSNEPVRRKIELSAYKDPITIFSATNEVSRTAFKKAVGSSPHVYVKPDLTNKLLRIAKDRLGQYRDQHIVAAEIAPDNIKAMFSTVPYHSSPLAVNLATNTLLRILDPNRNLKITITNFPLQSRADYLAEAHKVLKLKAEEVWTKSIVFGILTPIGLALLAGSFIVAPVEEKICKGKQLQLMTGTGPIIYWTSFFLWDYLIMLLVIAILLACFPIFQNKEAYTSFGGAGSFFLILLVFGSAAIPFSYISSLFSDSVIGGFSVVTIFHIFTGILFSFATYTLEEVGEASLAKIGLFMGISFPCFGASYATMKFVSLALENSKCNMLEKGYEKYLCDTTLQIPDELRQCCAPRSVAAEPYLTWTIKRQDRNGEKLFDVPGIAQMLLILFILGILYHLALILIENKLIEIERKTDISVFVSHSNDDDVVAESERVDSLVKNANFNQDALLVQHLCKNYGTFPAVCQLSFGVHPGECFGLLGVNGAGKTTTFRMLTGDESRSNGNAFAKNLNLDRDRTGFLANIGYCPQNLDGGLIGVLSGQQMLELYCNLRGVKEVRQEATLWLERVGLKDSASVHCGKYSGGMKRRLSAAMACVGGPEIIMLDEPTSGVDPISRREFWKVIQFLRDSGRAVILTSHSMDEIEALCSRLGIMVNGELQCFGSPEHLKKKFAQGFTISIKLKSMVSADSEELNMLDSEMMEKFSPCTLADKHQISLVYQIHDASFAWNLLFKTMEEVKAEHEDLVEEYSIMESTLEEVFLSFARKQYAERKIKSSNCSDILRLFKRRKGTRPQ